MPAYHSLLKYAEHMNPLHVQYKLTRYSCALLFTLGPLNLQHVVGFYMGHVETKKAVSFVYQKGTIETPYCTSI